MCGVMGRSGRRWGGCFHSHDRAQAVIVIVVDVGDVMVVIDGHSTWNSPIQGLMRVLGVGYVQSGALGAIGCAKKT